MNYLVVLLFLFSGCLASANDCSKLQSISGTYTSTECKVVKIEFAGKNFYKEEECNPIIEVDPVYKFRTCSGSTFRILGKEIWNNMSCSNKFTFEDPNKLLENFKHGSKLQLDVENCTTIQALRVQ